MRRKTRQKNNKKTKTHRAPGIEGFWFDPLQQLNQRQKEGWWTGGLEVLKRVLLSFEDNDDDYHLNKDIDDNYHLIKDIGDNYHLIKDDDDELASKQLWTQGDFLQLFLLS